MDGSQLLLKTDFLEARRGYDKAQVDDFLRALSGKVGELKHLVQQATKRAEAAEARLRSAVDDRRLADKARVDLEAALRSSEAARGDLAVSLKEARSKSDVVEVGGATGILAMAKRTAEATVDEAVQRAHRLVEDAEVNAAVTQLEAEQRAERARRDMEDEIEALRRQKLDQIAAEVRRLSVQRDVLQADVAALREFLDAERRKLREGVDLLARMLDHDGPVALGRLPVGNSILGESPAELPYRQGSEPERPGSHVPQLIEGPPGDGSALGFGELMDQVTDTGDADRDWDRADALGQAEETEREAGDDDVAEPLVAATDNPSEPVTETRDDGGVLDLTTDEAGPGADADLTGGDLPDPASEPAGWGAGTGASSPLGQPRADADAAMRAFFEADSPDERRGLRWRR
jgi:hypothetical protein